MIRSDTPIEAEEIVEFNELFRLIRLRNRLFIHIAKSPTVTHYHEIRIPLVSYMEMLSNAPVVKDLDLATSLFF